MKIFILINLWGKKMKKEIIGILVCTLLIATAIPTLGIMQEGNQPAVEKSNLSPYIEITKPVEGDIYFLGNLLFHASFLARAWVIGPMTFEVNVNSSLPIECVNWYVDSTFKAQYTSSPYDWTCPAPSGFPGRHEVKAEVIDYQSNTADDTVKIIKFG
jgi:hypothetical protein